MALSLNKEHRQVYGEKLADLGNIALGAFVFGQVISEQLFSPRLAILGIGAFVTCYFSSYFFLKGGGEL